MARMRVSVAWTMAAVVVLALLLRILIIPAGRLYEWRRLDGQNRAILERILSAPAPRSISPGVWQCAGFWVGVAYSNVCFSPEHVITSEMARLRDDFRAKLVGPTDLETLQWIWARLGETGPHGRRYIERFESEFRACVPTAPSTLSTALPGPDQSESAAKR